MRLLLVCLVAAFNISNGQNYLHNRYTLERMATQATNPNQIVTSMPAAPPDVKGDVYLNKTFNLSVFELYDGRVVEGFLTKLDLNRVEFDVITPQGLRVLKGNLVRSLIMIDSLSKAQSNFVNTQEWKGGEPLQGFFEILVEGEMTLARKSEVIFKKADFHPALNVGSRDHQYIRKDKLYYIKNKDFFEVPQKKDLMSIFNDRKKEMSSYLNRSTINLSRESDIARLVAYYNSLF